MNSNVEYAVTLVNIVLLHWNAKYNHILKTLHSISHDSAFISYHPYEFYQRTLLALFQMNNTNPVQTQFIQKPVYSALGMLSNLATYAGALNNISGSTVMSLWTKSHRNEPLYFCGIVSSDLKSSQELKETVLNVTLNVTGYKLIGGERFMSLSEYLESGMTDPVFVWKSLGEPSYPNATERQLMRKSQVSGVLTHI